MKKLLPVVLLLALATGGCSQSWSRNIVGGAAVGTGVGAAAGAMFGPIGWAKGAAMGAIGGAVVGATLPHKTF